MCNIKSFAISWKRWKAGRVHMEFIGTARDPTREEESPTPASPGTTGTQDGDLGEILLRAVSILCFHLGDSKK